MINGPDTVPGFPYEASIGDVTVRAYESLSGWVAALDIRNRSLAIRLDEIEETIQLLQDVRVFLREQVE